MKRRRESQNRPPRAGSHSLQVTSIASGDSRASGFRGPVLFRKSAPWLVYRQENATCGLFTNMLTSPLRSIEFFETASGRCPAEEFLYSLSGQDAQKVAWVLRLVERLEVVPEQYLKKLSGARDLWEIRAQAGGASYRLLGFFDGPRLLVLTNGFSKKQRKTPAREIDIATKRRRDYLERKKS